MKQISKRILSFFLISLLILVSIIFIINTYFAEEIEKSVISKIEQKLEAPLILDDVEFTIYDNFPYASVKIENLLVLESNEFNNDTLIFTKCAYVEISLLDVINKIYDLQSIIITDAKINIAYNNIGRPNFLIFKKKSGNQDPLSIKKITLLNTKLNIKKESPYLDIRWDLKRSIITITDKKYIFNIDAFSKKLVVGITDYINTKKIEVIAETKIRKDTITIVDSKLDIEDLFFNVKGSIFQGNTLDLEIQGKGQKINQLIKHLPKNIQKTCSPFIANGRITFNSSLSGLINKENNPLFEMNYEVTDGDFKLKSIPFELHNIQMKGDISNGKERNFNSTKIRSDLFKANTQNGYINGKFKLTNLNNYFLTSQFRSSWDLKEVNKYFIDSPFLGLKGRLFNTTEYKGNIAFNSSFKKLYLNADHKSNIKLANIQFNYQKSPLKFTFESIDCKIEKHNISVSSCKSTISETDFHFKGEVLNLIAYILNQAPKIYVDGEIKSNYINLSELMQLSSKPKSSKNSKDKNIMKNWINANTNMEVEKLSYKNFTASYLSGNMKYVNKELTGSKINAQSLNGEIDGMFALSESDKNNIKLISNIKLKRVNIRNSFDAFNNYGQKVITKEQIKGIGSAELNIESHWNSDLTLNPKKLKIQSHLVIEKGELIDFKPLENLSSYVSLEELKHVKFSTLENTIDISNEVITIPTMEIKSSALSVFLSGTHTFNQEINYDVTLLLSELLSTSFRKKNTKITEFGEEKKDGKIFNTIYFKMTGKTETPKISLNKIRFMEDVNNSVKKEKEKISNIIKEDILQTKEKNKEEKGQKIEIEWNPEL